jgi:hypothetical protein
MKRRLWILSGLLIGVVAVASSAAVPAIGDTIELETWFQSYTSSAAPLALAEKGTLDSISQEGQSTVRTVYTFSVRPTDSTGLWAPLIPASGIQVRLVVDNVKSSKIIDCSSKFSTCSWLTGITSDFSFIGNTEFYFPILPQNGAYQNGDNFTVRLNDTIGIRCTIDPASAQVEFKSELFRYSGANDAQGTRINIDDPLRLKTSNQNPFRFGGIAANSAISPYVSFSMNCCGSGYYGLSVTGYHPATQVRVRSFTRTSPVVASRMLQGAYDLSGRNAGTMENANVKIWHTKSVEKKIMRVE